MSQKDVERTQGRLLTDASFRRVFFRGPARACLVLGVDLAPHEREARDRDFPVEPIAPTTAMTLSAN